MATQTPIKPLILAGGRSTRMHGQPKQFLVLPSGKTLIQRTIHLMKQVCGSAATVYISVSHENKSDFDELLNDKAIELIVDNEPNSTDKSAGPSSGMCAAHLLDPEATWLVVACDYPILSEELLRYLFDTFVPPVTCFINEQGYIEPLIGVWGPEALASLASQSAKGPAHIVRKLGGLQVEVPPDQTACLLNVNTRDDWGIALRQLQEEGYDTLKVI